MSDDIIISQRLIQRLTREVRQAIGIERTPVQVEMWCLNHLRRPQTAILRVLGNANATLEVANMMRIPYLEKSPPSSEWE